MPAIPPPQKAELEGTALLGTAQAISCWLSTAEARIRAQVRSCGFVEDKVALG
jgi:hypothetical protein